MKFFITIIIILLVIIISWFAYYFFKIDDSNHYSDNIWENILSWWQIIMTGSIQSQSMTLALSAPRSNDSYYKKRYDDIMTFIEHYAKNIIWHDNVVIFVDKEWYKRLSKVLPPEILIPYAQQDIWMRDFTLTNPWYPIQRRYTPAAQWWKQSDSDFVQNNFNKRLEPLYTIKKTPLLMDWGNIVDNYKGDIIVTDRFLEDNNLTEEQWIQELKDLLHAKRVAIIPNDDPDWLAHADGMLAWIDDDVIALNEYDKPLREQILHILHTTFPDVKIIEVEAMFDDNAYDERMSSACGINVNSVMTFNNLYVPVFWTPHDDEVIDIIQHNTKKKVFPIIASQVCDMGWSVRCLTRQSAWDVANILLSQTKK